MPKWVAPWIAPLALLGLGLSGCGPVEGPRDGGLPDDTETSDAASGASANVLIPGEPIEAGDATIRSFDLNVASLRLVSDRGPDLDPVRTDIGPVDLGVTNTLAFGAVPPASYSAVVLVMDGAASQLELRAIDPTLGEVHVVYGSRLQWMARCGSGVPVRVGETLSVEVRLELQAAWDELREGPLPAPVGGVVEVNEASAPLAMREFIEVLGESIRAECRHD